MDGIGRKVFASTAAGLVAGTTNLVAAAAIYGGTPAHGFQMIASGLLGERAFGGGEATAVLGASLHYGISIVAAAIYLWAAHRSQMLRAHWLVGGIAFGVAAYLVMNLIVVPLSNAATPDFSSLMIVKELLAHTMLFGIPIAGVVQGLFRRRWVSSLGASQYL
jgi:hypothetical protein